MSGTAVITNGDVEGSVSNCLLRDTITSIDKKSVFNLVIKETHSITNSCTGQIENNYTVPRMTGFGGFTMVVGIAMIIIVIVILTNKKGNKVV